MAVSDPLREVLRRRANTYDSTVARFQAATGHGWHSPTPPELAAGPVSVVIPAHDMAYSLPAVLDALARQDSDGGLEVIVIDDASIDGSDAIARRHSTVSVLVRLPSRMGAAAARNVGTVVARHSTILYQDADMVLPSHVVADVW